MPSARVCVSGALMPLLLLLSGTGLQAGWVEDRDGNRIGMLVAEPGALALGE